MFTDFKHSHVCTLSDSNNCLNFRWNDMAILNQKTLPIFVCFVVLDIEHIQNLIHTKQVFHHWARSLPYFPFFSLLFFFSAIFKFKNLERFIHEYSIYIRNIILVLSSLKFLLCLPNFLSSFWMSSSLLLLCYVCINTTYWVLLVYKFMCKCR